MPPSKTYLWGRIKSLPMSFLPLFFALQLLAPWHIIVIVLAILLLFGGKKIPELMKGLGQGIKEFKDASKGDDKKGEDSK